MNPNTDIVTINADDDLRPRIHRKLGLPLYWDDYVDDLPVSSLPVGRRVCVKFLRAYRRFRPKRIGDRCCFEPSCSRYSEMTYRETGIFLATKLTVDRLRRCGNKGVGGTDLPPWRQE